MRSSFVCQPLLIAEAHIESLENLRHVGEQTPGIAKWSILLFIAGLREEALRKLSSLRSSSGVALLIFGDAGAAVSNAAPERVRLVPSPGGCW